MRAREIFFESLNSDRIEKLLNMIRHPNTETTIKRVAMNKLKNILEKEPPLPVDTLPSISHNIKEEYLDTKFINNLTFRDILERLSDISPTPSRVEFMRQGQIAMLVKPPFLGLTKNQYFEKIISVLPGVRKLSSDLQLDQGYQILISWI